MSHPSSRSNLLTTAFGLAVAAAALAMAFAAEEPTVTRQRPDRKVAIAAVETAESTHELRFAGTVRAARRASLAFTLGGRVAARPVELGDEVAAGEVLLRLDGRELDHAAAAARAALAELDARLEQLTRDAEREARLLATRAATGEEVERATATLTAARASRQALVSQLAEAERMVTETVLRAPFAGTVAEVLIEAGEHATAGRPVVVVSGKGGLEVEVGVPESVVAALTVGQTVSVELPFASSGARQAVGELRSVGRSAVGVGRLFPLIVALTEGSGAVPGTTANVVLTTGGGAALAVPLAAIVNPGGAKPAVFTVVDDHVRRVAVEVDRLAGDMVVVRGELVAGDLVAVAGHGNLIAGDAVEVVR